MIKMNQNIKRGLFLILLISMLYIGINSFALAQYSPPQSIADLKRSDDVKEMGRALMQLSNQLHFLKKEPKKASIVVMIHGYGSQGYEWIYPLIKAGQQDQNVAFYRWDDQQCHQAAAKALASVLENLAQSYQDIILYAHSYGGIIAALASAQMSQTKLRLNIIASPLAGHPKLKDRCDFNGFEQQNIQKPVQQKWTHWKTIKALDNAFKDLEQDVQTIVLPGLEQITLPESYQNQRLGHNWSISYVIDQTNQ